MGSLPIKKFLVTLINETKAKSWYTVAIPMFKASLGESNIIFFPSTIISPLSGL